ncbi:MAG: hypothetical protein JO022_15845, partial [Acidobacteriaceae bacterium]|nr:hypothetical protein [Acidobacteriaceae bacterium]
MAITQSKQRASGKHHLAILCLVASDTLALLASASVALFLRGSLQQALDLATYLRLSPFVLTFLAVYHAMGLYSTVALKPASEFRRCTITTSLLFM